MATAKPQVSACGQFAAAFSSSLQNRYLLSNIVYAAYASAMLYIDLKLLPDYNDAVAHSSSSTSYSSSGSFSTSDDVPPSSGGVDPGAILRQINGIYLGFGIVHMVNSFMYYWSWLPAGYRYYDRVMIPEYLNMVGACLYLKTATLYNSISNSDYDSDETWYVHHLESSAAFIEVVASLGWAYTWWLTYPRAPGRGWTFDDPDLWGIIFIVVPSWVYLWYNVSILRNPLDYETDTLYTCGDLLYAVGSYAYIAASLRDDGWFWWAPQAGRLYGGLDDKLPFPPRPNQADTDGIVGSCLGFDCGCGPGAQNLSPEGQPLVREWGYTKVDA